LLSWSDHPLESEAQRRQATDRVHTTHLAVMERLNNRSKKISAGMDYWMPSLCTTTTTTTT
jgi:hypothetical protein